MTLELARTVTHYGVYAVFVLMALDAMLPAGGELTMLAAGAVTGGAFPGRPALQLGGMLVSGAEAYLVLALAGTAGSMLGAVVAWAIGWRFGDTLLAHGRILGVSPDEVRRAERWFARHGSMAVLLGRLTPVVRSFISIPAGVLRTPLRRFVAMSLAASAVWCFGLAGAGWVVGRGIGRLDHALRYVDVVAAAIALGALALLLAARRRRRASAPALPR